MSEKFPAWFADGQAIIRPSSIKNSKRFMLTPFLNEQQLCIFFGSALTVLQILREHFPQSLVVIIFHALDTFHTPGPLVAGVAAAAEAEG